MIDEVVATPPATAGQKKSLWQRWLVWGFLLAFLALLGWGLYRAQAGQLDHGPAPEFTLELFEGGTFRLSEQRGKVVMVDFWASWCIPCRQEASMLEALWQAYRGRGVVFVGVAYADTEPAARAFLEEFGITYPNGPDLGTRISNSYRMQGVPEKFFIDRQGQIRAVIIGPAGESEYRRQLEVLLAGLD
ncbi:MAG: TlpA family protein disulfide reductase [Chloroflexi bacterium]|nr:TlpA family protein disulfide reductase [Chloroflexota bacterium]